MTGKDTYEERLTRDGKGIFVNNMTVTVDGKTAKLVYEDKLQGTTSKADAKKQ